MQHEHVSAAAERNQLCCSPPLSYSDSVEQHRACGGAGPGQDVAHDTGCSAWEGGPADYMDIIGYFSASYTLLFPTPSPELPFGPTHTPGGAKLKATAQRCRPISSLQCGSTLSYSQHFIPYSCNLIWSFDPMCLAESVLSKPMLFIAAWSSPDFLSPSSEPRNCLTAAEV